MPTASRLKLIGCLAGVILCGLLAARYWAALRPPLTPVEEQLVGTWLAVATESHDMHELQFQADRTLVVTRWESGGPHASHQHVARWKAEDASLFLRPHPTMNKLLDLMMMVIPEEERWRRVSIVACDDNSLTLERISKPTDDVAESQSVYRRSAERPRAASY